MRATALGVYQLLDRLAIGGMAEVFLARRMGDGGFSKLLVIKRILPHLAADPSFVQMFLDEARLAAGLNHPALVQVFDLGNVGNEYYLAMEYLAGEDLRTTLKRCGRMPADLIAWVIARAAEGLHHAHEACDSDGRPLGIVHRDVAPSNLFLTWQGTVKVLDFGVALARGRLQQTQTGQLRGTLPYMSPEQAKGATVDRRTDIWSLGVCLFEGLTGQRLFDGPDATLYGRLLAPTIPAPSSVCDAVPKEMDSVVLKALEPMPQNRYQTADELRVALDELLLHSSIPTSTQLTAFLRTTFGDAQREKRLAPYTRLTATASETPQKVPSRRLALAVAAAAAIAGAAVVVREWEAGAPSTHASNENLEVNGQDAAVASKTATSVMNTSPESVIAAPLRVDSPPSKTVDGGTPRLSVRTKPRTPLVRLTVRANVSGVLRIDGVVVGSLPVTHARIPAGRHVFRVENPQLGAVREWKAAVNGESETLEVVLKRGTLNVAVVPWAEVWVDGQLWSHSPVSREVWEGTHSVRLVRPRKEKTVTVVVKPGQTAIVNERLDE